MKDPPFFHFLVFSVVEDDNVRSKIAQCPNCGVLHRIIDINRSNILVGRDDSKTLMTINDLKLSLPTNLVQIMESHDVDFSQWEHASFILENELWGDMIVLSTEVIDTKACGKYVRLLGRDLYKVETFEVER